MPAKSEFQRVVDEIDRQIADLTRTREFLIQTRDGANPVVRRRRTRKAAAVAQPKNDTGE